MLIKLRHSVLFAISCFVIGFIVFAYSASINKVTDFIIFCIYVLGFDVLYGHMGRISFGHTLYLGAGAYGTAMFAKYVIPDPFLSIAIGIITGAVVGIILGPIVVKTKGAAFALINVAFNQVGYFLVLVALARFTGGEDGVSLSFKNYGFINFNNMHFLFYFSLVSLVAVYYLMYRLYLSAFGAMLIGIKENEIRVRFLGYNTHKYKWIAFIISTSISAFAGSLYVVNYGFVNPSFIDPARNVEVIFAALIGGPGTEIGVVVGGTAYMVISNYLPKYITRWEMFLGIALLIIAFKFRKGIMGYIREFVDKRIQALKTIG
ncbi:MAG TPA: branched-chain amino acid ABC transporter permease [Syntrophorhabdaceae bacterium]|nr:branched-chain amino acid ABC transporter permease [Syntrophorhabdaceae bacterium]